MESEAKLHNFGAVLPLCTTVMMKRNLLKVNGLAYIKNSENSLDMRGRFF
jgi:hypothetical protein